MLASIDFRFRGDTFHGDPALDQEIYLLRKKLEDAVQSGNSLSSDLVVLNSRLLDEKINEFMKKS